MTAADSLDVQAIKEDFPLLAQEIDGRSIHYLDSAATSQKPRSVLDAMDSFYRSANANVHRGVYRIAEEATSLMEAARGKVARFVGASGSDEIVFTKNATESMNLLANSWGRANLARGDVVVLSEMEHHANIVPWHMLATDLGIRLRWIPVDKQGRLDLTDLDATLEGARLLSITAMSNVLGTINPIRELAGAAHDAGAQCFVDACQMVPHLPMDVRYLGADAIAFSGHKMCGPTGIGVLWGRRGLLEEMPPFLGGGEMIRDVRLDGFTTNDLPWKFEAGTPPIAEVIGLGAAVDYLESIGMDAVRSHERYLTAYALAALSEGLGEELTVHGPADPDLRGGVLSIGLAGIHAHDISQVLDKHNVYVRAGHHCAKPLMRVLGVGATARASLYLYNDERDVDALVAALSKTRDFFGT